MPGEDIVVTGTSLGPGVTVRFGDVDAQVVNAADGSLTVKVPALPGAPGTEYPGGGGRGRRPFQRAHLRGREGPARHRDRAAVGLSRATS